MKDTNRSHTHQIHRIPPRRGLPQGEGGGVCAQAGRADENRSRWVERSGAVKFLQVEDNECSFLVLKDTARTDKR